MCFFGAKVEIIFRPLFHSKGVLRFVFVVFENDSPVVVGIWNERSSLAFPFPIDSQFFHSWNENVDCVVGGDGGVGN